MRRNTTEWWGVYKMASRGPIRGSLQAVLMGVARPKLSAACLLTSAVTSISPPLLHSSSMWHAGALRCCPLCQQLGLHGVWLIHHTHIHTAAYLLINLQHTHTHTYTGQTQAYTHRPSSMKQMQGNQIIWILPFGKRSENYLFANYTNE